MGKKMGFIIFAAQRLKAGKTATHLVAWWSVSPKQQQQQHKEISLQSNRNVRQSLVFFTKLWHHVCFYGLLMIPVLQTASKGLLNWLPKCKLTRAWTQIDTVIRGLEKCLHWTFHFKIKHTFFSLTCRAAHPSRLLWSELPCERYWL